MLTCCVCAGAWAQETAAQGTAGSLNVPTVMRNVEGTPTAKNQVIVVKGGERQGVIKIQLAGSANCRDMQFDLTLPEGITLAEAPTDAEPVKMVEAKDANHVLFYALEGTSTVKIAVVDKVAALGADVEAGKVENATNYGKYLANDIVFELPIAVASGFVGVKDATIANLAFTDDKATADIPGVNATFGIDALMLGDVNDTKEVNLADAVSILYSTAQFNARPEMFIEEVADVNGDGSINQPDAVGALYIGWGVSPTTSAKEVLLEEDNTELDPE